MFEIVEKHLPSVHCYADDTQLYVAFSPNQPGDDEAALKAMSNCIRDLGDWMVRDRLKLNEDKMEVVLIGTGQQLAKVNVTSIAVGDETIEANLQLEIWGHGLIRNLVCRLTYVKYVVQHSITCTTSVVYVSF